MGLHFLCTLWIFIEWFVHLWISCFWFSKSCIILLFRKMVSFKHAFADYANVVKSFIGCNYLSVSFAFMQGGLAVSFLSVWEINRSVFVDWIFSHKFNFFLHICNSCLCWKSIINNACVLSAVEQWNASREYECVLGYHWEGMFSVKTRIDPLLSRNHQHHFIL